MNAAIIFAGGVGRRMKSQEIPKQFLKVDGKPIIIHTIEHFEHHREIDLICVVCLEDWIPKLREYLAEYDIRKVACVIPGGSDGMESIRNGLYAVRELMPADEETIVLIHDGVRPFINETVISDNIRSVKIWGNAITVAPLTETLANIDAKGDITEVQERARCRLARAPQSFYLLDIIAAHEKALREGVMDKMIDSATLMINYGFKLHTVDGPVENIKITTPYDYLCCIALMNTLHSGELEDILL